MENRKLFKNALILNRDPNWYKYIDDTDADTCRASLEECFSWYKGAITDICLAVFEQTTMIPSEAFMWRGMKYLQKQENGYAVDYSGMDRLRKLYNCYAKYNVDAVQIFIDCMHKLGIRPWLSFRMNDVHYNEEKTAPIRSDMSYEEAAAGHKVGEEYGYYASCYDFTYPRYKNALLGYIKEVVDKYDFFGLELDFMRECICFDYLNNPDCHKIMTEYIREVKAVVKAAEKRVGHEIKISIRTPRSLEDSLAFGFDLKTLCAEGLVDVVIPTPRWTCSESYLPIREWRAALGEDVAILGGIEALNLNATGNRPYNSRAYAAAFYAMSADGIYFNNHEDYSETVVETWSITPDNALTGHREFVVLYQDKFAYPEKRYKPLPLEINGTAVLPLEIGKVTASHKVKLVIDFEGETAPTVTVCGKADVVGNEIEPITVTKCGEPLVLSKFTPYEYELSGISTDSEFVLNFTGNGKVHYVKVVIDAE